MGYKLFLSAWFGYISGFSLMLSGSSLNYWLAKEGVDVRSIGAFAFILIPYSLSFCWAPILDKVRLGYLAARVGHRWAWLILINISLALSVFILSQLRPVENLLAFAFGGFFIALFSSAQDALMGALRSEIIDSSRQAFASSWYISGYRLGMLFSGSGAVYLSSAFSWQAIYSFFALIIVFSGAVLFLVGYLCGVISDSVSSEYGVSVNSGYSGALIDKVRNFFIAILSPVGSVGRVLLLLLFLMLYRLPDNFINLMINPFLLHIGYDEFEIASAGKFCGVIFAIIGGWIASFLMRKINLVQSLMYFGILHALAHGMFIIQEIYGKNLILLFCSVGLESVTGGMVMTAYITFISSLCQGKFRVTQYAFFSSMMGFSRAFFPSLSGYIVANLGWSDFYFFVILLTIPSLLILTQLKTAPK